MMRRDAIPEGGQSVPLLHRDKMPTGSAKRPLLQRDGSTTPAPADLDQSADLVEDAKKSWLRKDDMIKRYSQSEGPLLSRERLAKLKAEVAAEVARLHDMPELHA